MNYTNAKTQKIEHDPNLWRTKLSEAVCKREVNVFIFQNVMKRVLSLHDSVLKYI